MHIFSKLHHVHIFRKLHHVHTFPKLHHHPSIRLTRSALASQSAGALSGYSVVLVVFDHLFEQVVAATDAVHRSRTT